MEKKVFRSCFYIIMSFPTHSDISQNDTEILEKQWQEMQWLQVQLEEVVKLCWAECMAQKAKKEVEEKVKEEAER